MQASQAAVLTVKFIFAALVAVGNAYTKERVDL